MSLQTITEIDLDINQPFITVVHAKQYDTVRQVKAHLFYNGVKWFVPNSNFVAVVSFKKADRVGGFYDTTEDGRLAISVDSSDRSIVYLLLDRNTVTTAGNTLTEITFYDTGGITSYIEYHGSTFIPNTIYYERSGAEGHYVYSKTTDVTPQPGKTYYTRTDAYGRLSTFSFITQVEESTVTELDLTSSPYFNILAADIKKVIEAADALTGLTADGKKVRPADDVEVNVTGGTSAADPYVLHLGIPSMPGMTVSKSKLPPADTPTATITGGDWTDAQHTDVTPYNIAFGIPSMPGMTVSKSKLPPADTPTATITGGQWNAGHTDVTPYNIAFGIPSMPGMEVSASRLAYNAPPSATITGGQWNEQHTDVTPYHIAFGIPKAVGILQMTSQFGESANENTIPTTWVDHIEELTIPDGHFGWTKFSFLCDDGNTYISYSKTQQGSVGPPGVAVQHSEPQTSVKIWIDPNTSGTPIVIPEYTSDEDAMIHSFSGILLTTVKSMDRTIP